MLRGKVTRFGNKQQGVGLGGFVPGSLGNLGVKVTTADVRIDWRLVDVYSRKVIKTGSATASQKGAAFDVGVAVAGQGGNIGFNNSEFMNSALGRAACKAVTNIIQEVNATDLPESGRSKSKAQAAGKEQAAAQAAADAGLERVWSGRADECAASLAAAVRVMPVPHVGLEQPTVGVRALPGFTGGVPYPADDWAADGRVATPGVVDPGRPSSGAAAVLVHAVGPVLAHAVGARPRGGTEEIGTSSELGHGLPGCPSTKEGSV